MRRTIVVPVRNGCILEEVMISFEQVTMKILVQIRKGKAREMELTNS